MSKRKSKTGWELRLQGASNNNDGRRQTVAAYCVMEIIAHGLWAAAAAIGARRSGLVRIQVHRTVGWTVFPDVLAFGPSLAAGLWLKVSGGPAPSAEGHLLPHVHLGLPLYPIGHSLVIALLVFGVASLTARDFVIELFG